MKLSDICHLGTVAEENRGPRRKIIEDMLMKRFLLNDLKKIFVMGQKNSLFIVGIFGFGPGSSTDNFGSFSSNNNLNFFESLNL